MKRRSKENIGRWPNMRETTLRAISEELVRARKKHPMRDQNMRLLRLVIDTLYDEMLGNNVGKYPAHQVYARAAQVAALAIRVCEEGSAGFKYADYQPDFKLEA